VRLLVVAALAIGLVACGSEERLTVYSGRSQSLVGPLLERFSEESGIPIDVRYGESAELALLIDEEGDAGRADVFYSQSPGATGFLSEGGRLAELPSELLEQVDERFRDPDGEWVGITGRQRVLVYNTEQVAEADLPESVFDLTGDEYAGRVAVAPENGSFQDFVTAMRGAEGDEAAMDWLTALAQGGAPTYANNNAIIEAVDRGEVEMGLVNHYYALRFLEEDPDLDAANYVFGDGDLGALVLPSTASVTATSDNPDAMALISFLLSEEAQQFFAEETMEYPLAAGEGEPSLEGAPDVDVTQLGDGLERTLELIEESGLGG
jgi:iron(III) transport system substrate-binding protein